VPRVRHWRPLLERWPRSLVLLRGARGHLVGGANLFSSWRHEDEETWRKNKEKLEGYRVVYHKDASADLDLIPTGEALQAAKERVRAGSPSDFEDLPF
jgi:hypothetical protein